MSKDNHYYARDIIIATDILTVKRLLPMYQIYDYIEGQPFIRIYGIFNSRGSSIINKYVKKHTILSSVLQNIIPIGKIKIKDKEDIYGLYLIAYADNGNAQLLSKYMHDDGNNRSVLEDIICKSLGCIDIKGTLISIHGYYTYPGTHYYKYYHDNITGGDILEQSYQNRLNFIHKAQRPENNIFVVGELISMDQGWVEGALSSVEAVIPDLILHRNNISIE